MSSQAGESAKKSLDSDGSSNGGQGNHSETQKPADSDDKKTSKAGEGSCYCGKARNLSLVELWCAACGGWFHESCIGYQLGRLVPFMMNYLFLCKNCSQTGLETFKKNQATFPQMCVTAIANLRQESVRAGAARALFSKDREIIPYIEQYWEALTTMPRRVTQSWYATVQRALIKDIGSVFTFEEGETGEGGEAGPAGEGESGGMWGLRALEPAGVRPNYEQMLRPGQLRLAAHAIEPRQAGVSGGGGGAKSRSGKRQTTRLGGEAGAGAGGKRGRGEAAGAGGAAGAGRPSHGYPADHPYNKDGYRYILAEPDPHAPFRQEFDESHEWSGKPIPGWLYRALCPGAVLLAAHDRAPQLRLAEDRLAVTGDKGYCTVRATHGVSRGAWYWELSVEELADSAAVRAGWGRRYANLQAPLGYDRFGYSWRSRKGTRFHESRGKHYSGGYGEGDTLGFLLVLPDTHPHHTPPCYKDRPLVKFKSHLYYEDKDNVQAALGALAPLPGSKMYCFLNGACQGAAFEDIYRGRYYPAVSLYRAATVSVNFGPAFRCPPRTDIAYRPMCEKAEEAICEQTLADMLYLTDNYGKLRLDNYSL